MSRGRNRRSVARRSGERGFAYLYVIALLLAASVGLVALGHTVRTASADGQRSRAALRARLAAEAAIEAARAALVRNAAYAGEAVTLSAGQATVRVEAERSATARRRLVAVGRMRIENRRRDEVIRRVEVDVELRGKRLPRVVGWRER